MSQSEHLSQVDGYERESLAVRDSMVSFWAFCVFDSQKPYCLVGVPMSLHARSNHWLVVTDIGSAATYNHPSPVAQCRFIKFLMTRHHGIRSPHKAVSTLVTPTFKLTL